MSSILFALQQAACQWGPPEGLAYPYFRRDHVALRIVLDRIGIWTRQIDAQELGAAQVLCLTKSARACATVGYGSIAEGCALAVAGPQGRLVAPRAAFGAVTIACAHGGTKNG